MDSGEQQRITGKNSQAKLLLPIWDTCLLGEENIRVLENLSLSILFISLPYSAALLTPLLALRGEIGYLNWVF